MARPLKMIFFAASLKRNWNRLLKLKWIVPGRCVYGTLLEREEVIIYLPESNPPPSYSLGDNLIVLHYKVTFCSFKKEKAYNILLHVFFLHIPQRRGCNNINPLFSSLRLFLLLFFCSYFLISFLHLHFFLSSFHLQHIFSSFSFQPLPLAIPFLLKYNPTR